MNTSITSIKAYIARFPKNIQTRLKQMHTIIRSVAPKAEEGIAYGMPGFKLNGKPLVYFGGFEKHIGFFPTSSPIAEFEHILTAYKHAKGSIQLPHNKPLPVTLIKKLIRFRAAEIKANTTPKKIKKPA